MPEKVKDVRIVMLGKTGTGKSATGNTILGREVFVEDYSSASVTRQCEKHEGKVDDRNVLVVDTPGLFDTSLSNEKMKAEIVKCVYESVPGPHAFLLVIRLGVRFTEEERNAVRWIQQNFSKDALNFSMVLFTGGDQLKKPIEHYLKNGAKELQELVKKCKGGCHVFKNNEKKDHVQVKELLQKIDMMVQRNGGGHYTNEMYQEAQRKIREEEMEKEKKRMERKERRRREENELTELRNEIVALRRKVETQSNSDMSLIEGISKWGSAFGGFLSNAVDGVADIPSCMLNGVSNAIEELADAADSPGETVLAGTLALPCGLWGGVKGGLKQDGRFPKKAFQGLVGK